uniref:Uncharacterized protein n=1 Tax=Strigamia maritima TaxID=126957 RepID=T1IS39_STRMM
MDATKPKRKKKNPIQRGKRKQRPTGELTPRQKLRSRKAKKATKICEGLMKIAIKVEEMMKINEKSLKLDEMATREIQEMTEKCTVKINELKVGPTSKRKLFFKLNMRVAEEMANYFIRENKNKIKGCLADAAKTVKSLL